MARRNRVFGDVELRFDDPDTKVPEGPVGAAPSWAVVVEGARSGDEVVLRYGRQAGPTHEAVMSGRRLDARRTRFEFTLRGLSEGVPIHYDFEVRRGGRALTERGAPAERPFFVLGGAPMSMPRPELIAPAPRLTWPNQPQPTNTDATPVLLFPVRLETALRDLDTHPRLLLRIYPDQLSLDDDVRALARREVSAARDHQLVLDDIAASSLTSAERIAAEDKAKRSFEHAVGGAARARWVAAKWRDHDGQPLDDIAEAHPSLSRYFGLPERFVVRVTLPSGALLEQTLPLVSPNVVAFSMLAHQEPNATAWVTDFEAAVAAGLAAVIPLPASEVVAIRTHGLRRIVALGVCTTDSAQSALDLDGWLDRQAQKGALAFAPHGTPTNNVDDTRAGVVPARGSLQLQPSASSRTAAERLHAALGLPPTSAVLAAAPNAGDYVDEEISVLIDGLWDATFRPWWRRLGSWSDITHHLRAHCVRFLRPRGPLPALRVGKVPYGILPTAAWSRWKPSPTDWGVVAQTAYPADVDARLFAVLSGVSSRIASLTRQIPRVRGADAEAELVRVLAMEPRCASWALRPMLPESFLRALVNGAGEQLFGPGTIFGAAQTVAQWEAEFSTKLAEIVEAHRAELGGLAGTAPPARSDLAQLIPWKEAATHAWPWIQGQAAYDVALDLSSVVPVPSDGPADTVFHWLTRDVDFAEATALRSLVGTVSSKDAELLFRDLLDLFTARSDAWMTSLATRRLAAMRSRKAEGIRLGSFGYLEDLAPREVSAVTRGGFVHAPSIDQAGAAAIARSAGMHHAGSALDRFSSMGLDSATLRDVSEIVRDTARGYDIGLALGIHLERSLHDAELDVHIDTLRRAFPQRAGKEIPLPPGADALDGGARNVVDGQALLEKWEQLAPRTPSALIAELPDDPELTLVLERLRAVADAGADAFNFDALVRLTRSPESAGGTLESASGAGSPPDFHSFATQVARVDLQHRVCIVLPEPPAYTISSRPLVDAEPAIAEWLADHAPAMSALPVRARLEPRGASHDFVWSELCDLHPMEVAVLFGGHVEGGESSGERWLQFRVRNLVGAGPAEAVTLEYPSTPTGESVPVALDALTTLLAPWLLHGGPIRPSHLTERDSEDVCGFERADFDRMRARTTAMSAAMQATIVALESAVDPGARIGALLRAARWNVPSALPLGPDAPPIDELGGSGSRSAAALDELRRRSARAADALAEADKRMVDDPSRGLNAAVDRLAEAISALVGGATRVLPSWAPRNVPDLQRALSVDVTGGRGRARVHEWLDGVASVREPVAALQDALAFAETQRGDAPLAVIQLPCVEHERWVGLSLEEQSVDVDAADQIVAQRAAPASFARDRVSIVHHMPRPVRWGLDRVVGVRVDGWTEPVPSRVVTTGLSFHFDQPSAEAPQSLLLVVPSDVESAASALMAHDELFDAIASTMEQARARLVDLDALFAGPEQPVSPWSGGQFLPGLLGNASDEVQAVWSVIESALKATP